MSSPNDREATHWRAAILRLPDEFFFDLMRSHLGPLKTPYNKHVLLESLENYLRRPDVLERIRCAVSASDRRILTAIACCPDSSHEGLHRILGEELGFVRLHHILLNLEDRILIYRDPDSGVYGVTPLVAENLRGMISDISVLFPPEELQHNPPSAPIWSSDLVLTAIFVHLQSDGRVLKNDGELRKAAVKNLATVLPSLARDSRFAERCAVLIRGLRASGLVRRVGDTQAPLYSRFLQLSRLSPAARACLPAVALALPNEEIAVAERNSTAENCAILLNELGSNKLYSRARLGGLLTLRLATMGRGSIHRDEDYPEPTQGTDTTIDTEALLHGLLALGLICEREGGLLYLNPTVLDLNPAARSISPDQPPGGALVVQSTYELQLRPELPFADALTVVSACELIGVDTTLQLELSRNGIGRALVKGIEVEDLIRILERHAAHPIPQNVAYSLRSWEREYAGTRIDEGVILSVEEVRRDLIEHDPRMRRFIRRTLAPGVYLLAKETEPEWRQVLAECGVMLLPRDHEKDSELNRELELDPDQTKDLGHTATSISGSTAPSPEVSTDDAPAAPEGVGTREPNTDYEQLKNALIARLEEKQLPADAYTKLRDRIENRIILHEDQLRPEILRPEQTEAKGLDYSGKVRLIEQALSSQRELLELIERVGVGNPVRRLLKPMALKRNGTRLLLHGLQLPAETELRVDVSKIGLLRRVRGLAGDRL